ncbi:hypothetical protein ACU045_12255 [Microbacterium sp. MAHUQ-60]|uniref:hypothetical protein n=1 Tax=unclassified Microbacterium TaxID=2609290 RepID=UPI00360F0234
MSTNETTRQNVCTYGRVKKAIALDLGNELTSLIADRGMSKPDAAAALGWPIAKLRRVTAGYGKWLLGDIVDTADVFGGGNVDEMLRLIGIASRARQRVTAEVVA